MLLYVGAVSSLVRVQPVPLVYWLPGVFFSLLLLATDELRRLHIRRHPGGWVQKYTYYD